MSRWLWALVALLPVSSPALEPRFDHRDLQGPLVEVVAAKDVLWRGTDATGAALRSGVHAAWGFDASGDGDEIFVGTTVTTFGGSSVGGDRVRLTFDARYRAYVGTEELKTLFDVGVWGTAVDKVAVGPLVGLGLIYDFSRNFGVLASGSLGVGFGQVRTASFAAGVGVHVRFR